jgi:hypothetical protein
MLKNVARTWIRARCQSSAVLLAGAYLRTLSLAAAIHDVEPCAQGDGIAALFIGLSGAGCCPIGDRCEPALVLRPPRLAPRVAPSAGRGLAGAPREHAAGIAPPSHPGLELRPASWVHRRALRAHRPSSPHGQRRREHYRVYDRLSTGKAAGRSGREGRVLSRRGAAAYSPAPIRARMVLSVYLTRGLADGRPHQLPSTFP